jgi:hypothetical protein
VRSPVGNRKFPSQTNNSPLGVRKSVAFRDSGNASHSIVARENSDTHTPKDLKQP